MLKKFNFAIKIGVGLKLILKIYMHGKPKRFIQVTADLMSKYIRIHVYICLYPALYFFLRSFFDIEILPNFLIRIDVLGGVIFGLSLFFIPSFLWLILTLIFRNIHPIITVFYFLLFAIFELFSLLLIIFLSLDRKSVV